LLRNCKFGKPENVLHLSPAREKVSLIETSRWSWRHDSPSKGRWRLVGITAASRKCKLACRRLHPIFVAADCESLDTLV
jgi:hypothetical protein